MDNYKLWLEMRNHPEMRETLDYIRKFEIERDAARQRAEAAEARVKELEILVEELLSEYKTAKLLVFDEFVKTDYYDEAVAELNEKVSAYRVRAMLGLEGD